MSVESIYSRDNNNIIIIYPKILEGKKRPLENKSLSPHRFPSVYFWFGNQDKKKKKKKKEEGYG